MEKNPKQVSDFIFILLNIIIEQNIGPTHAARLLYVYTSLLRLGIKIIKPQTKIGNKYIIKRNVIQDCFFCEQRKKVYVTF